jgi:hypothetical protein
LANVDQVTTMVFTDPDGRGNECWLRLGAEQSVPKTLESVVIHCFHMGRSDYSALGDGEEFWKLYSRVKKFEFVEGQPPASFWTGSNSSVEKLLAIRQIEELTLHGPLVTSLYNFR